MMNSNIASVERALDILLLLYGEGKEMGVSEIANQLGVYKSTVHRTLATLQNKHFVQKNEVTDKYWLGSSLYAIGMMVANTYSLVDIVAPEADILYMKVKDIVNVSILHVDSLNGYKSVVIYKARGPLPILGMNPEIGSSMDAYASSVGKCMLAFNDIDWPIIKSTGFHAYTEHTITNIDALKAEMEEVREKGYAIDNEEREVGLFCVGAPIFNKEGKAIAAISISGPKARVFDDRFEEKVLLLKQCAQRISTLTKEMKTLDESSSI